jgi:hypothetical protein
MRSWVRIPIQAQAIAHTPELNLDQQSTTMYSRNMEIDEVKRLYEVEHLSAREIGEQLHKTVWQVIKFMKKHGLKRRKCNESLRFVLDRQPKSFHKKTSLSPTDKALFQAGLMLYWGEGVKSGGVTVDFTNSDPKMAKIFINMLRSIYRVNEKRIRLLLYCYPNHNIYLLKEFWSKLLAISSQQFIKPYVSKNYQKDKINKLKYGVIHIRYNDTKLFCELSRDIDIMANRLLAS